MPDYPDEVAGLPQGGPATLAAIKVRLGIAEGDTSKDARLNQSIGPANELVRRLPVAERYADFPTAEAPEWPSFAAIVLGAEQLAIRLDRRRETPDGVAPIGAGDPVYVARTDPDIAQLLELGPDFARPTVG